MKTFSAKPTDITRTWYVYDASEAPLGRLATEVAKKLIGKEKTSFTKHIDGGDFVIIINAKDLVVTGKKLTDKQYHNHSGFPGGLRTRALRDVIDQDVAEVIVKAVRGMLPVNKLRDGRLARLKVYAGSEHTHAPQKPVTVHLKGSK